VSKREGPFRDYPDDDEADLETTGGRTPQEMLSQQQTMMEGESAFPPIGSAVFKIRRGGRDGWAHSQKDQDERLNLLSHSIGRQNHLSIQIGSELDLHHELLEDTDAAMDRTAARLHSARRRLDRVASDAKQYGEHILLLSLSGFNGPAFGRLLLMCPGSTITIVGLIVLLLILIIVFKT
jgi:syntaxin 8